MKDTWEKCGIFEGEGPSVFPHSISRLQDKSFFNAGLFMAWSVLHGDPGLNVFPTEVVGWLTGQKNLDSNIDHVTDLVARQNIRKVSKDHCVRE